MNNICCYDISRLDEVYSKILHKYTHTNNFVPIAYIVCCSAINGVFSNKKTYNGNL